jgi:CRP-like cAMP-binding protein
LNAARLLEIRRLVRDIESAAAGSPAAEWLLPHMTRRSAQAGTRLFSKGDIAGEMFYVHEGRVRIVEYGDVLGPGTLIGEIGLFASGRRRTQSVVCDSDCTLYSLSQRNLYRLYYQNPRLGFLLIGLIVDRLMRDAAAGRAGSPGSIPA